MIYLYTYIHAQRVMKLVWLYCVNFDDVLVGGSSHLDVGRR